ncbi:hypothetical protein MSG28_008689 [Choristoneura fumiferana]|uniref:Uncharacterized protein n=1 Tax=Choristoneura fumiferana TaxID=7141 RepID=A0ACC0J7M0_CHOFU|nr:hypothetical protein MSG28_008689 [Choristoneura fumiferana]
MDECCGCGLWMRAMDACCGCVLWMRAMDACYGCVLWMRAMDACCGCVLWMRAMDACSGCVLWMRALDTFSEALAIPLGCSVGLVAGCLRDVARVAGAREGRRVCFAAHAATSRDVLCSIVLNIDY